MNDEQKNPGHENEPLDEKPEGRSSFKRGVDFTWKFRIELFSGVLLLIGIILSFFYIHVGGILVGLAVGICFYDEIYDYFIQLRGYYSAQGLFKTLMFIGTIVYLLVAIPAFIIFTAIGFGIIFLTRWVFKRT